MFSVNDIHVIKISIRDTEFSDVSVSLEICDRDVPVSFSSSAFGASMVLLTICRRIL
jgi:hypothetical protein